MAYKIDLSGEIHLVFHVIQLKCHVSQAVVQSQLPILGNDGLIVKKHVQDLERRMQKVGNLAMTKVLVR